MDRSPHRRMARFAAARGVAKPGYRAAFGRPRSPVRIRAPRPRRFENRHRAGLMSKDMLRAVPNWDAAPMFGDNAALAPRHRRITWEYRLAPTVDSIGQARSHVRRALERHVDADTVDRLELVVSELVTNAVRHGPHELITLRLAMDPDGSIGGEVEDQGHGVVAIRETPPLEGGLGLVVVDQLTSAWGVYPDSTQVWFRLEAA